MFVGHVAAGLAVKPLGREINLGLLVLAALLLDLLLWIFVLVGLEQVVVPPDFAQHPYLSFVFPYSHSLVVAVTWSLAAAAIAWKWARRTGREPWRSMLAAALAVGSHFLLDAAVHVPDLPLDRESPIRLGTGLVRTSMASALTLEILLVALAVPIYLGTAAPKGWRRVLLAGTLLVCSALTVAGGTLPTTPPPAAAAAWSGIVSILVVSVLLGVADRA